VAEGEIPEVLQYIIDRVDIIEAANPENNPVVEETHQRMREHKCMLCGGQLGQDTMISMNRFGIFAMTCGGACYTDLPVLHWIQEAHEEMMSQIRFRGGEVDADAPDSGG